MLKFAIIGVGTLGKVHLKNAIALEEKRNDIKLTALCDVESSHFSQEVEFNLGTVQAPLDLSRFNLYDDAQVMLKQEQLDFVITALPTYIHDEIACLALESGVHVFSEKPMARNIEKCQKMIDTAKQNNKLLMIGQCLRYWPQYIKLKEFIDNKEFGNLVRAEFKRYSSTPVWSWENWLLDFEKSGGAALDMHVHDVDFINWAFGVPEYVQSFATHNKTKFDSIFTMYKYQDKLVTASCDWSLPKNYPFIAHFLASFENASVETTEEGLKVYMQNGQDFIAEIPKGNAYVDEVEDFIDCILNKREPVVVTAESAMLSAKIALAEIQSALDGKPVLINI